MNLSRHALLFRRLALGLVLGASFSAQANAPDKSVTPAKSLVKAVAPAKNIVLVHGAFADASGWRKVISLLTRAGYRVTAVQNPLTSAAEDIATTRRVIDAQKGPTVVVAHSYGGTVASQAAVGARNVKAIVYLAAFVPLEGETSYDLLKMAPPTPLNKAMKPDSAGFAYIDRASFRKVFCADLPAEEAQILAIAQKPIRQSIFDEKAGPVAWKNVPVYYQISDQDMCVNPQLQRKLAARSRATVIHLKSSHVGFLSKPREVVALIERAAKR